MDDLAKKAISGDPGAERELFQRLLVRFQYLAKLKGGEEHCDDIAQEACVTIAEKYKNETFTVSFTAWAHGVLKMKIGNYLQQKKRAMGRGEALDEALLPPSATVGPADADLKRFLLECLGRILSKNRAYARALNLAHQGFSTAESCRRLGVNANHFYVSLNRGRRMLRECLEEKGVAV